MGLSRNVRQTKKEIVKNNDFKTVRQIQKSQNLLELQMNNNNFLKGGYKEKINYFPLLKI